MIVKQNVSIGHKCIHHMTNIEIIIVPITVIEIQCDQGQNGTTCFD